MLVVIVLLFCLIIAVFITSYYQYTIFTPLQEHNITYKDLTLDTIRTTNAKYGFSVSEADLPTYVQLLNDEVKMNTVKTYKDMGYEYIGSYKDYPQRTIPNRHANVKQVNTCLNYAKNSGDSVAGIQYGGECRSGNSVSNATMLGKHPSTALLGTGWNNQVYVRNQIENTDMQYYDDLVSWMMKNGIKDYPSLKLVIELNNVETFTTYSSIVEGATPQDVYPGFSPSIITPTPGNIFSQTESIISDISGFILVSPLDPVFVEEIKKVDKSDFPKLINLLRENMNKYNTKGETPVQQIPSVYVVSIINVLSEIGYKRANDSIIDTLDLLNKIGVFTPDILKLGFTEKYKKFGMNPESDFVKIISKLNAYKIQDTVEPDKLTFALFTGEGFNVFGLNVTNLFDFSETINGFYSPNGKASDFRRFILEIKNFDTTAPVNLERVRVFRDTLMNYGTNFLGYTSIIDNYLTIDQRRIATVNKDFIQKFVNYYNKYSSRNVNDIKPIGNSSATPPQTTTLREAISIFFDYLKKKEFNIPNNSNFNLFLDEITTIKLSIVEIPGHIFKKKYDDYLEKFTGYSNYNNTEQFTNYNTYEGFEDNSNGYADALTLLGFTDVNKMPVYWNKNAVNLTNINGYQLDNKLKTTIGVSNSNDQYIVLSYFSQISMPGDQIYILLDLFKEFNIPMSNFKNVTDSFNKLNLTTYTNILHFLQIIIPFGVSFQTLPAFSDDLLKFNVNISDPPSVITFLKTMSLFDIIYKPSIYDNCNTKFSNFVFNFTYDKLNYTNFNSLIYPILIILNDGVIPTSKDLATVDKKAQINKNMRDVIIRKDQLFYGINNPNEKNNKSLIGECYIGPLNPIKNYDGKFSNFSSNNYTSSLTSKNKLIPFSPLYELTSKGTPSIIKSTEKDQITRLLTPNKKNIDNSLLRFDTIIPLLTSCQYNSMKKPIDSTNLIERSVMSRLLSLLITKTNPPQGNSTPKDTVSNYNSYAITINMIRFMPYKMFRIIANEIYSNNKSVNNTNTNKYDPINSESNRSNSSNTYLPVIQECAGMTFS